MVHARDIEEIIERELVPAEFRHLAQVARENRESCFPTKLNSLSDLCTQKLAERREKFRPRHAETPSSCRINSRFCSRNELAPEIFSCNFIRPASSASGRGGQPEM